MNSFESTIREIEAQKVDIPSYASYLNSFSIENVDPSNSIFVGAGDSLACAKFIKRMMGFKPRSFDPYDLKRNREACRGKKVYFISVSGRTRANVEAAAAVRDTASETIAITANTDSPLSKACKSTLALRFTKAEGITPGTNSFTACLLACSRLFGPLPESFDLNSMFDRATRWAESHSESAETVHFVGTGYLFPIAMYGAAKVFEFTGGRADYQLTEEFSHLNLFTLNEKDFVVILKEGIEDLTAVKLSEELNQEGYCAHYLSLEEGANRKLEAAIYGAICMQYFALKMALRKGLDQPAFLENQKLLQISNRMIYVG